MRDNWQIAVIFLDVDGFKTVNDTFGHDTGDQLLKIIGQRLQTGLSRDDLLARFGGDEFAIGLVDSENLPGKITGIQDCFKDAFVLKNKRIFLTLSIGIALAPEDGITAEELMKNADLAMYAAKGSGKNKTVFCNTEMKMTQQRQTELSHDLHQASERGELSLLYQPQIDGITGAITGLEALIRWQHRQLGAISPGLFIPIAEKNG